MMRRFLGVAAGLVVAGAATAQNNFDREVIEGVPLPDSAKSAGVIETMADVLARDAVLRASGAFQNKTPSHGTWTVPSPRSVYYPKSGHKTLVNKWGDTSMGMSFDDGPVTVVGAWFSGQGSGERAYARGIRAVGYRDGQMVGATDWLRGISDQPKHLAINLEGIDRLVIEALPGTLGGGWWAMDDFAFIAPGAAQETVLDFEDLDFKATLTDSRYAGISWEQGTGEFFRIDDGMPAPISFEDPGDPIVGVMDRGAERGGAGTAPTLTEDFQTIKRGDVSQFSFPPDTCGAVGPNHFMCVVNTTVGIYNKTGSLLQSMSLQSFFPGSSGGDPRVVFDQHSQRWIVMSTDFNTRVYIGVSQSNNPTGSWFKSNFVVSTGALSGCWPDFPTLGYDDDGIYIAAFMFNGCAQSMWALEKAPLVAGTGFGTITVFPNFTGFVGAVQPCHTFGNVGQGEFTIERSSSNTLRIRQVQGNIAGTPSLITRDTITVTGNGTPPDAPANGASTPLDSVDTRLSQAIYRNGSIWVCHCINVSGRAAVRWYEVNENGASSTIVQQGTVNDPSLAFIMPSICVNSVGDAVIGFTGSDANTYPSTYFVGRSVLDGLNVMSSPQLYRAGSVASYNLLDGFGRNRWGDYSATTLDPADDLSMWTIQEYVHSTNIWGTHVAKLEYNPSGPGPFSLTTPAAGATGVALSPFFQWTPSPGASSYLLEVDDNADFSSPEISQVTTLTSFTATADPLTPAALQHWRVTASNPFGSTVSTPASQTFTTTGPLPGFFVLVTPGDGATEPTDVVTLSWSASTTTNNYRLEVDDNADFSSPEIDDSTITPSGGGTESFTTSPGVLLAGSTYNWRVTAQNIIGDTPAANAPFTFDIAGAGGCDGDADGNGVVDVGDVGFVIFRLGDTGAPCIDGDADGSGTVDVNDIGYVIFRLGTCNTGGPCP